MVSTWAKARVKMDAILLTLHVTPVFLQAQSPHQHLEEQDRVFACVRATPGTGGIEQVAVPLSGASDWCHLRSSVDSVTILNFTALPPIPAQVRSPKLCLAGGFDVERIAMSLPAKSTTPSINTSNGVTEPSLSSTITHGPSTSAVRASVATPLLREMERNYDTERTWHGTMSEQVAAQLALCGSSSPSLPSRINATLDSANDRASSRDGVRANACARWLTGVRRLSMGPMHDIEIEQQVVPQRGPPTNIRRQFLWAGSSVHRM